MSDRNNYKNVLILGGYGKAGQMIATILSEQIYGCISIAGRSLEKAEACVRELRGNPSLTASVAALGVDAADPSVLTPAFDKQDLVIVCVSLDETLANNIVEAVVNSTADYIDIVSGHEKYRVLGQNEAEIRKNNKRFLLDAAVDPGLPGWLAQYAALQVNGAREVKLFARYRDRDIGRAGIQDILDVSSLKPKVFDGQWKVASPWRIEWPQYPGGFGRGVSLPVFLPELERVPQKLGLDKLALFHAGVNNISDLVVLAWKLGLHRVLPKSKVIDWLLGAIRNHTHDPTGVAMVAEAKSDFESVRVKLWHYDLYRATAIPTALVAIRILFAPRDTPGCWFLGEWVETLPFKEALEGMGFHFEIQQVRARDGT